MDWLGPGLNMSEKYKAFFDQNKQKCEASVAQYICWRLFNVNRSPTCHQPESSSSKSVFEVDESATNSSNSYIFTENMA